MVGRGAGDRRRRGPGALAIFGSIALHGLVVAVFWVAGLSYASPLPPMKAYQVNIVSPPPAELGPMQEAIVAEPEPPRPTRQEPPREVESEPVVVPEPQTQEESRLPKQESQREEVQTEREEAKREESRQEERRESERRPPPREATGQRPEPEAAEQGSGMNIRIEGEVFPFPGYLEQIAVQIGRYFRWTGATGLSAEIYFEIMRDGSVRGIRLVRGSGSAAFNFEAMGAIEQAGNRRAFGPLPDGYTGDRLPVSFYFQPAR